MKVPYLKPKIEAYAKGIEVSKVELVQDERIEWMKQFAKASNEMGLAGARFHTLELDVSTDFTRNVWRWSIYGTKRNKWYQRIGWRAWR